MGLFQHATQDFLRTLVGFKVLQVQRVGLVGLHGVKRPQNQTFHLQLVDAVQLRLNAWTKVKRAERKSDEMLTSEVTDFCQLERQSRRIQYLLSTRGCEQFLPTLHRPRQQAHDPAGIRAAIAAKTCDNLPNCKREITDDP